MLAARGRFRRFSTQQLPHDEDACADWITDVHFTYVAANRATHTQLHITFNDSEEPEQERGRRHNTYYWFDTSSSAWTRAGDVMAISDDDLSWYKTEALTWAQGVEAEYLNSFPEHSRPQNEFG